MKNILFLTIKIIIVITIYIVCALSGVLCGALSGVLCSALLSNCRAPHSTPQNSSIFVPFLENKIISTTHKKEGFINYIKNNMSRWIGLYLPFWPDLSAHQERKRNERCQIPIIYGYIY